MDLISRFYVDYVCKPHITVWCIDTVITYNTEDVSF